MAKRATYLKGEYAGYRAALDRLAVDEALTQVGPGTPGASICAGSGTRSHSRPT